MHGVRLANSKEDLKMMKAFIISGAIYLLFIFTIITIKLFVNDFPAEDWSAIATLPIFGIFFVTVLVNFIRSLAYVGELIIADDAVIFKTKKINLRFERNNIARILIFEDFGSRTYQQLLSSLPNRSQIFSKPFSFVTIVGTNSEKQTFIINQGKELTSLVADIKNHSYLLTLDNKAGEP